MRIQSKTVAIRHGNGPREEIAMIEFPRGGFENEVPRGGKKLPCALVVDTSGSVGLYEEELRAGVRKLIAELQKDQATAYTVEVMLIFFDDDVRIAHPFTNIRSLEVPEFDTGGRTHMYEALDVAYSEIRVRQEQYKVMQQASYAPFIVLLTDGKPVGDDDTDGIVAKIRSRNAEGKLVPYPFAIGDDADEELLKSLREDGRAFRVDMNDLDSIFEFVSVSLSSIASEKPTAILPNEIQII